MQQLLAEKNEQIRLRDVYTLYIFHAGRSAVLRLCTGSIVAFRVCLMRIATLSGPSFVGPAFSGPAFSAFSAVLLVLGLVNGSIVTRDCAEHV